MSWEQSQFPYTQISLGATMEENSHTHYRDVFLYIHQVYRQYKFILAGNKKDLLRFKKYVKTKHVSIRFEYQIS